MNISIRQALLAAVPIVTFVVTGCHSTRHTGTQAEARLNPMAGNQVKGTVHFHATPKGVRIVGTVTGLAPGDHGFHIYEQRDCSEMSASLVGGHFNPSNMKHGGPGDAERHSGDLGNITADASGTASIELTDLRLGFAGASSIIGRTLVVHARPDDLKTQMPPGNAGPAVACGRIVLK